eukprot:3940720-Pleurochrysis_carterae.AAC.1
MARRAHGMQKNLKRKRKDIKHKKRKTSKTNERLEQQCLLKREIRVDDDFVGRRHVWMAVLLAEGSCG